MGLVKVYPCTEFEVLALCVTNLAYGSHNLEIRPLDSTTPVQGYFVIRELRLAKFYLCTKFKVSRYTRSEFAKEVPKFKKASPMDPNRPPFGEFYRP